MLNFGAAEFSKLFNLKVDNELFETVHQSLYELNLKHQISLQTMRQNCTTADRILQLETEISGMKRALFLVAACPDGFGVQGTSCEFYQRLRTEMESQKTQVDEIKLLTSSIVAMRSKEAELRKIRLSSKH